MRRGPLRAGLAVFGLLVLMILASRCRAAEIAQPQRLGVRVLGSSPHDATAYTQGLLWHDGVLYESTGHYGESRLRRVALTSGEVLAELALSDSLFGEGLARIGERLVQLTWKAGRALIHDLETLEQVDEWTYQGEGWGLCFDGAQLWMSDGSSRLQRRDGASFALLGEMDVTLDGKPVGLLNELECAEGWIYANVYETDFIVRIDPLSGRVDAVIDASGLLTPAERETAEVLNGIAYDEEKEVFYLTGKFWPRLFEVTFEETSGE